MKTRFFTLMLACAMALLSGQCVFGQEKKTVAVIPAQGKSAGEKIKDGITGGMEEGVRRSDKYELLPRDESFAKALGEMKLNKSHEQEVTNEQLMQFGRALGANFVFYALVEKYKLCLITYRMVNVSSGKTVKEGSELARNGGASLLAVTDNISKKLFAENSRTDNIVEPKYPGGIQKFREYIMSNLEGVNIKTTSNQISMLFRFVIEKDGGLTDIKILDDGGYPETAEMAVKALDSCPKWNPATSNGRPIRMLYTIPLTIKTFIRSGR